MSTIDLTELTGDLDDLDSLNKILAGGKEKGIYERDAIDFLESGKMGRNYEYDPTVRKAQSVKTGFESALDKIKSGKSDVVTSLTDEEKIEAASNTVVKVRTVGEGDEAQELVFLVRQDLVNEAKKAQQAA